MFRPRLNVCLVSCTGRDRFVSLRVLQTPETVVADGITFHRTRRRTHGGWPIYVEESARG